jgi:hypothetical protein
MLKSLLSLLLSLFYSKSASAVDGLRQTKRTVGFSSSHVRSNEYRYKPSGEISADFLISDIAPPYRLFATVALFYNIQ